MKSKIEINREVILALNPCQNRFDNFVEHYGSKTLSKAQFMGLKKITQEDKLWVAFRLMPKDNVKLAAADIAESVLYLYEAKYPNDLRPRRAIEAARTGTNADAAHAAAKAAYAAAYAVNIVDASAYAAAYAAHVAAYVAAASYADNAIAYAAANAANAANAAAAYAAANAAESANAAAGQEKLIRKIVMKYWR